MRGLLLKALGAGAGGSHLTAALYSPTIAFTSAVSGVSPLALPERLPANFGCPVSQIWSEIRRRACCDSLFLMHH